MKQVLLLCHGLLAAVLLAVLPADVLAIAGGKKAVNEVKDSEKEIEDNDSAVVLGCGPMAPQNVGHFAPLAEDEIVASEHATPQFQGTQLLSTGPVPLAVTTTSTFLSYCSGTLFCGNTVVSALHCKLGKNKECDTKISSKLGPANIHRKGLNQDMDWIPTTGYRSIVSSVRIPTPGGNGTTDFTNEGFAVFQLERELSAVHKLDIGSVPHMLGFQGYSTHGEIWGYGIESRQEAPGSEIPYEGYKKQLVGTVTNQRPPLGNSLSVSLGFTSDSGSICQGDSGGGLVRNESSGESTDYSYLGAVYAGECLSSQSATVLSASAYRDPLLSEVYYSCSQGVFVRLELDPLGVEPTDLELRAKIKRSGKLVIGADNKKCHYPNPDKANCERTFQNKGEGDWLDLEATSKDSRALRGEWSCRYDNWISDTSEGSSASTYPPPGIAAPAKGPKASVFAGPYGKSRDSSRNRRGLICRYLVKASEVTVSLQGFISNVERSLRKDSKLQLVAVPVKRKETFEPIEQLGRLNSCLIDLADIRENHTFPLDELERDRDYVKACRRTFKLQIKDGEPIGNWLRVGGRLQIADASGRAVDHNADIQQANWSCQYNKPRDGSYGLYPPEGSAEKFNLKPEVTDTVHSTDTLWVGPHDSDAGLNTQREHFDVRCTWALEMKSQPVMYFNQLSEYDNSIAVDGEAKEKKVTAILRLGRAIENNSARAVLKFSGTEGGFALLGINEGSVHGADSISIDEAAGTVEVAFPSGREEISLVIEPALESVPGGSQRTLRVEITSVSQGYSIGHRHMIEIPVFRGITLGSPDTPIPPILGGN